MRLKLRPLVAAHLSGGPQARPFETLEPLGLSGILCARLISSLSDEPFAEDDGELGLGLEPLTRRPLPFLGRVVENEI